MPAKLPRMAVRKTLRVYTCVCIYFVFYPRLDRIHHILKTLCASFVCPFFLPHRYRSQPAGRKDCNPSRHPLSIIRHFDIFGSVRHGTFQAVAHRRLEGRSLYCWIPVVTKFLGSCLHFFRGFPRMFPWFLYCTSTPCH